MIPQGTFKRIGITKIRIVRLSVIDDLMRWVFGTYALSIFYVYFIAPAIPLPAVSPAICSASEVTRSPASDSLHFDSRGLVVQADGDGGDSAQRIGMLYFKLHDPEAFARALDQLEIAPGVYVRHPAQEGFRSDPNRFSRDQQRAIVMALGEYEMQGRLFRLAWAHFLRFGKYQNADYLGPSHLSEYIRAFRAWPLYPVLFITDMGLVVSSLDIALRNRDVPDEVDDNNHLMALIQASGRYPTPVSWVAQKIYRKMRPLNLGNSNLGETDPAQGAISWYHRKASGGNPFIAELYRPAISSL